MELPPDHSRFIRFLKKHRNLLTVDEKIGHHTLLKLHPNIEFLSFTENLMTRFKNIRTKFASISREYLV